MLTPFQSRAARALSQTPFFGALEEGSLRTLERAAVRKGDLLFEKGEPSDRLFALISGQLKLFSSLTPTREVALELVAPGELVGQLAVLHGGPQHASVKALAHSELAAIRREDVDRLLGEHPELLRSLSSAAAASASRLAERAEDAAFLSIELRLEKVLTDLAQRFGEGVEQGVRIRLRQQELADVLGVSRESVSRALATSVLAARVEVARGSIVLRSR